MAIIRGNDNRNALAGTDQADAIFGYDEDDALNGQGGGDTLFGGFGDDTLRGNDGNDLLHGDVGSDDLFGGFGADRLFGGRGADRDFLFGGGGVDTLVASDGFDFLDGGEGTDLIIGVDPASGWTSSVGYSWGVAGVVVNLSLGVAVDEFGTRDSLVNILDVDGTDRNDRITGDDNGNFITAYAGNDTISGGAGEDEVSYNTSGTQGIFANLFTGVVEDNHGDTDQLRGIERIRATGFDDRLIGSAADNVFRPLGGDDVINGGAGFDEVWYDRDLENGGFQGVVLNLGGGFVEDAHGTLDSIVQIEGARGTLLDDRLLGDGFDNRFHGEAGDDVLAGGAGDDTLTGGQGRDIMNGGGGQDLADYGLEEFEGGWLGVVVRLDDEVALDGHGTRDRLIAIEHVHGTDRSDLLTGSDAANSLDGAGSNDVIRGRAGNDVLAGGAGNDHLLGQAGRDTFRFERGFERDRVGDFDAAGGEVLDFSAHADASGMADLTIRQEGADTFIDVGGDLVMLTGVATGELDTDNFLF